MADTARRAKAGKKNRKHGRNKNSCKFYAASHRHERSHLRRIKKHLTRFPEDRTALAALERFK